MNRPAGLSSRGYRCLLRLYPACFRAGFAAEMDEVFSQASADAAQRGWGPLAGLFWPAHLSCARVACRPRLCYNPGTSCCTGWKACATSDRGLALDSAQR